MKVAIVGAGAAGTFCAIELKRRIPSAEVDIFEALPRPLAKVSITGGGRCNLTNSFEGLPSLAAAYPRGERLMKYALRVFSEKDCCDWFEREGVRLVLQDDHCVFPKSQDAMEIVHTLLSLLSSLGVRMHLSSRISSITQGPSSGYCLKMADGREESADAVVVTSGGVPKEGAEMLGGLGINTVKGVASLFSFNLTDKALRELMGAVVENASVSLAGTKFSASGPLLVTHWGMSGPAILKLSSYAARHLFETGYTGKLLVNWTGGVIGEPKLREWMDLNEKNNPQKMICGTRPEWLTGRLWTYLVTKSGIRKDARWAELGSKGCNRLINTLICDEYEIRGKSRFKEEFVTCGGVALGEVDLGTLEAKKHPGLYFAGEVLDIDAITGGFNLQAAWTTGYIVAKAIEKQVVSGF